MTTKRISPKCKKRTIFVTCQCDNDKERATRAQPEIRTWLHAYMRVDSETDQSVLNVVCGDHFRAVQRTIALTAEQRVADYFVVGEHKPDKVIAKVRRVVVLPSVDDDMH